MKMEMNKNPEGQLTDFKGVRCFNLSVQEQLQWLEDNNYNAKYN